MVIVSDQVLKTFFQTGDKPTASQFGALIDSMVNKLDDAQLLGLRVYDSTRIYAKGDTAIYNFVIYECTGITTTGTFQANDWKKIAGGTIGGISYKGTWDAATNTPDLLAGSPVNGDYYVVAVAGNTDLDGITDWNLGDWAIYNGESWQKIFNSQVVTDAENTAGDGIGTFQDLVGTVLRFKKLISLQGSIKLTNIENRQIGLDINFEDTKISKLTAWSSQRINEGLGALEKSKEPLNPNIQRHISDMNNPHKTTKDQIGLGSVTNDQQLSIKSAVSSEEISQNDTTEFETKLSAVFRPAVTGKYLVQWYFELGSTKEATQMEAKVEINTVKEAEIMRISQHGLVTQFDSASGMVLKEMEVGTQYTVTIQYRKRVSGTPPEEHSCRIRRARLVIMKA
jgi:hypothetical protein